MATDQPASEEGPGAPPARRRRRKPGDPATSPKEQARRKNTRRIAIIAGTAALTTAVSGIVGGVISPERVESVLGLSAEPSESASESASDPPSTEPELEFKRVTDGAKAIAVDVPVSWGVHDDGFTGIDGITGPGLALRAGPDPAAFRIQSDETAYVGASTQALDDLGLVGLDDAALSTALERRRESVTYLSEAGCVPTNDHRPRLGDDWVGVARVWQDCFSIAGWRAIEVEMVSTDREVYVFIQIGLPAATPDQVSQRLLDSLTVLPGVLPTTG